MGLKQLTKLIKVLLKMNSVQDPSRIPMFGSDWDVSFFKKVGFFSCGNFRHLFFAYSVNFKKVYVKNFTSMNMYSLFLDLLLVKGNLSHTCNLKYFGRNTRVSSVLVKRCVHLKSLRVGSPSWQIFVVNEKFAMRGTQNLKKKNLKNFDY